MNNSINISKIPAVIPPDKQALLETLISRLSGVTGVIAIVLGGSYARGTHHTASDLDLGIYYAEKQPFQVGDIRRIALEVSSRGEPVATGFYAWGPWVNGGAWIQTSAGKVDFLYRNLDQVRRTIEEAIQGIVHHDYNQQPTFGFYSVIYLGETQVCFPLIDPRGVIAQLKQLVETYPPKLKEKLVADSLWSAEFTFIHAQKFASMADVYNTAGCLARIASNLTQALFALNEKYFINDKTAMAEIASFSRVPPNYIERLSEILARPGRTAEELSNSVKELQAIWEEVVSLAGKLYKPPTWDTDHLT